MKNRLFEIILFFVSVITYGQVNIATITDKKEYNGKDIVDLTIVLEVTGIDPASDFPQVWLPDLSKFETIGKASNRNFYIDDDNTTVYQLIYQLALQPKQAGNIKIGSSLVSYNGKRYKSEPFDIFIDDKVPEKTLSKTTSKSDDHLYINMEVENTEVYKNQPAIGILKAYSNNFNNLRKVSSVELPEQKNIQVQPVSFEKSEIEMGKKSQVSSQVIAIFMIFPKEAGSIEIKPAKVHLKNKEKLVSNKVHLNVKNFPKEAPAGFNEAVGKFNLNINTVHVPKGPIEINKPVDVVVTLRGEGNMGTDLLPKIVSTSDYKVYHPNITRNLKNGKDGINGVIEAHYVVVPSKAGILKIHTTPFSFFDPKSKDYVNVGEKSIALNVMTPEEIEEAKTALDKVNDYTNTVLDNVNVPMVQEKKGIKPNSISGLKTILTNYSIIAGVLGISIILIGFFKKLKTNKSENKTEKIETVAEMEERLREHQNIDVLVNMEYLDKLLEETKFDEYFTQIEGFINDLNAQYQSIEKVNFKTYLERNLGQKTAENYREILQKIRIEKYAPAHSKEGLMELQNQLASIFNQIA